MNGTDVAPTSESDWVSGTRCASVRRARKSQVRLRPRCVGRVSLCRDLQIQSQDDAPLCFRPFEGYYSSRAARRLQYTGSVRNHSGGPMRKPRPATYNPVQALHLIANDRNGSPLSCPSCSGQIERTPDDFPPPPRSQVTLQCRECGRVARYIAGAA